MTFKVFFLDWLLRVGDEKIELSEHRFITSTEVYYSTISCKFVRTNLFTDILDVQGK